MSLRGKDIKSYRIALGGALAVTPRSPARTAP
jgi:hypothetical protein